MALTPEARALLVPLTEIEKAELLNACQRVLTPAGLLLLRRALVELDRLRERTHA